MASPKRKPKTYAKQCSRDKDRDHRFNEYIFTGQQYDARRITHNDFRPTRNNENDIEIPIPGDLRIHLFTKSNLSVDENS